MFLTSNLDEWRRLRFRLDARVEFFLVRLFGSFISCFLTFDDANWQLLLLSFLQSAYRAGFRHDSLIFQWVTLFWLCELNRRTHHLTHHLRAISWHFMSWCQVWTDLLADRTLLDGFGLGYFRDFWSNHDLRARAGDSSNLRGDRVLDCGDCYGLVVRHTWWVIVY